MSILQEIQKFCVSSKFEVDDECWRWNVLVTILRYWWRFWPFLPPTSSIFQHKRRAPTSKRCHQYRNSVTNIRKLSPRSTCHQHLCSQSKLWILIGLKRLPAWAFCHSSMKFKAWTHIPLARIFFEWTTASIIYEYDCFSLDYTLFFVFNS